MAKRKYIEFKNIVMNKNFTYAFEKMIQNEGGFVLHKNEGDRGGWTFAGIAENFWPNWKGWPMVKSGDTNNSHLTEMVKLFYKNNFWDVLKLDLVDNQIIAYNLFDFAVNAGFKTSAKLAQIAVNVIADGVIGKQTIAAINKVDQETFEMQFALAKINRYVAIVDKRPSQIKFLKGWVKRTLNVLSE